MISSPLVKGLACSATRRVLLARTTTNVCSKCSVVSQKRFIRFNPFNWKYDEKATPKQKELSQSLEVGGRADVIAAVKDPTMKLFEAQPNSIPLSQAKLFPKLKYATPSFGSVKLPAEFPQNEPSLVCITLRPSVALDMASSWIEPFTKEFPELKSYNITVLTNPGFRLLGPLLQINLRSAAPKERWQEVGVHYAPVSYFTVNQGLTDLGLINTNVFAAYIFIVQNGVVRWKAVGLSNDKELDYMRRVISELRDENVKKEKKKIQ